MSPHMPEVQAQPDVAFRSGDSLLVINEDATFVTMPDDLSDAQWRTMLGVIDSLGYELDDYLEDGDDFSDGLGDRYMLLPKGHTLVN